MNHLAKTIKTFDTTEAPPASAVIDFRHNIAWIVALAGPSIPSGTVTFGRQGDAHWFRRRMHAQNSK